MTHFYDENSHQIVIEGLISCSGGAGISYGQAAVKKEFP